MSTTDPDTGNTFIPDEPTDEDHLDFGPYATALAELIAAPQTQTPLTMGLFGTWGSGKSSLMQLIQKDLKQRQGGKPIVKWFPINVWELGTQEELWNAFIQALLTQAHGQLGPLNRLRFDGRLLWRRLDKSALVRQLVVNSYKILIVITPLLLKKLWPQELPVVTNPLLSLALGIWLLLKPILEAAKEKTSLDLSTVLKKAPYEAQVSMLQRLKNEFAFLVETLVGKNGRLVVFIDDLDRCVPDKIPEVLEALKLFATTKGCVYVLGMDQDVVSLSIEARYKEINKVSGDQPVIDGMRYLEKIIQLPFLLPLIQVGDIDQYIKSFNAAWPNDACPDIFARGLPPNPRQIKRAVNVFFLLWQLTRQRRDKIGPSVTDLRLAKVVALQMAHPEAFDQIKDSPQLLQDLEAYCLKPPDEQKPGELGKVLQELVTHPDVMQLFRLHQGDPLAVFGRLGSDDLATFFSLARRVPAPETETAAKVAQATEARAAADLSLHQLLPPPRDLTGRDRELKELLEAVTQRGVNVIGVQGSAGMGKTALALTLADQLKERYPDAQFYVDCKGTSTTPLSPTDALAHIIRAYKRPAERLPEAEAELRELYRSVLGNKRALVFAENARDHLQVEPLTPPAACLLIVTSRGEITLPGLFALSLDKLSPPDARELLQKIERRLGDPEADEIAQLCSYNPLALRLAASTLVEQADLSPAEYIQRLRVAQRQYQLADGASLNVMYDLLNPERQRLWCMLTVFPGSFDAAAAGAVWDLDANPARSALNELVKYGLVRWTPHPIAEEEGRYALHEVPRAFASAHLGETDRNLAAQRHAVYYKTVAAKANQLFLDSETFKQGLDLFDSEWDNIWQGQAWAAAHAEADEVAARLCNEYPDAAANLLELRQKGGDRLAWRQAALNAARRLKDRAAEGIHLGNLGYAYLTLGDLPKAIECFEQQLPIVRDMGDRASESNALGNLGLAYTTLGKLPEAIEKYEKTLDIKRKLGDRRGEAATLGNLGNAYLVLGKTDRAVELFLQRLAITREIGDRLSEGNALSNLGSAYIVLGEARRAIEFLEQAIVIDREIGDRRGEGTDLGNLGLAYGSLDESQQAIEFSQQALVILREVGDQRSEAVALWNISRAQDKVGNRAQAIANAKAALKIFEPIQDARAATVSEQLAEWEKPKPAAKSAPSEEPLQVLTPRVLQIVFDPIVDPAKGIKLSQRLSWNRADDLAAGYIADVEECSNGLVKYQIADRVDVNAFPPKLDGFTYDIASYLGVLDGSTPLHDPDQADYQRMAADFDWLKRVAKDKVDEVWLFAFPYAGLYESRMAGKGAFWCNAPALENTDDYSRRIVIMGFTVERGVGEMLEDLGHRAESILEQVFARTRGEANLWKRFSRHDLIAPGKAEVGLMHLAPNSERDYDWGNPRMVPSRCDDWYSFPNFRNVVRQVNCQEWGNGDIRLHHKWWFKHLPRMAGRTQGVAHNWWQYVIDPNNVKV